MKEQDEVANLIVGLQGLSHPTLVDAIAEDISVLQTLSSFLLKESGGYVVKAVHFDGSTYLSNTSFSFGANTKAILWSVWFANTVGDESDGAPLFGTLNEISQSFLDGNGDGTIKPDFNQYNDLTYSDRIYGLGPSLVGATWHHVLAKIVPSNSTQTTVGQMVIDGVYQTQIGDLPFDFDGSIPFTTDMSIETTLWLGITQPGQSLPFLISDIAQAYLAYGDSADIDLSDPANVAKFIAAGKPVDVLTSGAPIPLVLFDGDAESFGLNQGSGGAFTLTGTLTNASTSPSD